MEKLMLWIEYIKFSFLLVFFRGIREEVLFFMCSVMKFKYRVIFKIVEYVIFKINLEFIRKFRI